MPRAEQYQTADALARTAMVIRPNFGQVLSLDEWLAEFGHEMPERERAIETAAANYNPDID